MDEFCIQGSRLVLDLAAVPGVQCQMAIPDVFEPNHMCGMLSLDVAPPPPPLYTCLYIF